MKSILIAAALVGGAVAGLIIYSQRKNREGNRITDAAGEAYGLMNEAIGRVERPMHHAMG